MTENEPTHTQVLRAMGVGGLLGLLLLSLVLWNWRYAVAGVVVFFATALVDSVWDAVDKARAS